MVFHQVPMATDDVDVLQRITKQLFSHFHIGKTIWQTYSFFNNHGARVM